MVVCKVKQNIKVQVRLGLVLDRDRKQEVEATEDHGSERHPEKKIQQ